ncbi:MAG: hypothetical protein MUE82_06195 [Chloroflexi bacterium]|jgi:hypothetical protein|nr:hypothetical protein [Chloroflexota bacterium]
MWPDPGAAELEEARRAWTVDERLALAAELRDRAFDLAWAAVREREEREGRLTDLDRARFVLSRLYPEMIGPRLEEVMSILAAAQAIDAWRGFTPPESFIRAGGLS